MICSLAQGEQTTGCYRYDYTLDKRQRLDHDPCLAAVPNYALGTISCHLCMEQLVLIALFSVIPFTVYSFILKPGPGL
jgi:hypothetical protein